uniref:Uncharacterized protein n=1 Tax=Cacopsylla melanoneura TaxID=428564 RepID=A0A8D8W7A2_9HEMI
MILVLIWEDPPRVRSTVMLTIVPPVLQVHPVKKKPLQSLSEGGGEREEKEERNILGEEGVQQQKLLLLGLSETEYSKKGRWRKKKPQQRLSEETTIIIRLPHPQLVIVIVQIVPVLVPTLLLLRVPIIA